MTEIFQYDKNLHYELFKQWWDARSFPAPNADFLPAMGAMVYEDKAPVCGGFLFQTDGGTAVIGHLVSNPGASGAARDRCLDLLLNQFVAKARLNGFKVVSCSTNLPKLMERFVRLGFTKTDENVSHFGRLLCP